MRGIIVKLDLKGQTLEFLDERQTHYVTGLGEALAAAQPGMQVDFELESGRVTECSLYRPESFDARDIPYSEVREFAIYRTRELPEGQELLGQAPLPVEREGRSEDSVKWKLMSFAKQCGANCLIEYQAERYIKNSIGFSYYMYRGHALPAVAAKLDLRGAATREELLHKLNEDHLKREYLMSEGVASGRLALKIVCGVLLAVFCAGFLLSTL